MTAEVESIFTDEPGPDQVTDGPRVASSAQDQSGDPGGVAHPAPPTSKRKGALPFHPKFLVMGIIFVAICVFAFRDQLFGADQQTTLTQGSPEFARPPVQQPPPTAAQAVSNSAQPPTTATPVVTDELGWKDSAGFDAQPAKDAQASPESQDSGWSDTSSATGPAAPRHDRKSAREVALAEDLYQANKRADDATVNFERVSADIEKLKLAMDALEKKVASLPAAMPSAAKSKPAAVSNPKPATQVAKRAPAPTKQAAFRINTIYADQAWIDKGDRTYIVQVGDVLDGARVLRIDTTARRVVTTAGDIR